MTCFPREPITFYKSLTVIIPMIDQCHLCIHVYLSLCSYVSLLRPCVTIKIYFYWFVFFIPKWKWSSQVFYLCKQTLFSFNVYLSVNLLTLYLSLSLLLTLPLCIRLPIPSLFFYFLPWSTSLYLTTLRASSLPFSLSLSSNLPFSRFTHSFSLRLPYLIYSCLFYFTVNPLLFLFPLSPPMKCNL